MMIKTKFEKYDRVKVIKSHHEIEEDGTDTTMFVGQIGHIVEVDKWDDGKYPFEIEFEDEEVQELNEKLGTFLWEAEQLIFWSKEKPIGLADLQGIEKTSPKVYHEPVRVTTINKNDLQYMLDSIDINIKKLHSQQNTVEAVLYSLITLRDSIEKRMKELE